MEAQWDLRAYEVVPGCWDVSVIMWRGASTRVVLFERGVTWERANDVCRAYMEAAAAPWRSPELLDFPLNMAQDRN